MRDPASSFLLRALITLGLTALVLALAYGGPARGGQLDHYLPQVNDVRDFLLPDKGVYAEYGADAAVSLTRDFGREVTLSAGFKF